jgi:hypothetical protein
VKHLPHHRIPIHLGKFCQVLSPPIVAISESGQKNVLPPASQLDTVCISTIQHVSPRQSATWEMAMDGLARTMPAVDHTWRWSPPSWRAVLMCARLKMIVTDRSREFDACQLAIFFDIFDEIAEHDSGFDPELDHLGPAPRQPWIV